MKDRKTHKSENSFLGCDIISPSTREAAGRPSIAMLTLTRTERLRPESSCSFSN